MVGYRVIVALPDCSGFLYSRACEKAFRLHALSSSPLLSPTTIEHGVCEDDRYVRCEKQSAIED